MIKFSVIFISLMASIFCLCSSIAQDGKVALPSPQLNKGLSVEKALSQRRSVRDYAIESLDLGQISQLLWSAQGITSDWGGRTAPSAGATYPMEIYVVVNNVKELKTGLYHYENKDHTIRLLKEGLLGNELSNVCLGQTSIKEAPVNIIITAVFQRTAKRYGERAERYVFMEAGHIGQNIYLQSESLGLGTVVIGAFHDEKVKQVLEIDEEVLVIMPVGKKR